MDDKRVLKDFKAVEFMRKTRDEISKEIADMTPKQIIQYFKNRREKLEKVQVI